jgi:hypothetical protein
LGCYGALVRRFMAWRILVCNTTHSIRNWPPVSFQIVPNRIERNPLQQGGRPRWILPRSTRLPPRF